MASEFRVFCGMASKRPDEIDRHIALKIRAIRLRAGLSQSDLAGKLGVTFQQVQKYEKGVNRVGAGRLFEIARVLGVPVRSLFPDEGEFDAFGEDVQSSLHVLREFLSGTEGTKLCERYMRLSKKQRSAFSALLRDIEPAKETD
jgi:transcriptional regulator with XRE-family HTH domain